MRLFSIAAVFVAVMAMGLTLLFSSAPHYYRSPVDVSWPNCKASVTGQVGIIGVTGGLSFRHNPCLRSESTWFSQIALYMNTGYPGAASSKRFVASPLLCPSGNQACLAYNYGYNAAIYAINYAASQGVYARVWWLDVETDNSWSMNPLVNRASLAGALVAMHQRLFQPTIGFYSYPAQWQLITGSWHDGLPNWVATGGDSRQLAATYCYGQAFNNGPTWITQYTQQLDINYACTRAFMRHISPLSSN